MKFINHTKQAGFTLVELIIVIVILGILSAFAIPKFIDVSTDARTAAVDGLQASVESAANLAYAQAVADSIQGNATGSVTMQGATVAVAYGYPSAVGIENAVKTSGFTFASGKYTKDGAPTPADCSITYAAAASAGATYTITRVVTGC